MRLCATGAFPCARLCAVLRAPVRCLVLIARACALLVSYPRIKISDISADISAIYRISEATEMKEATDN